MERKTNEKVWTVIQGREEESRNKMAFWYEPKMGDLRDTLFFQLSFVTKEYCPKYMHSCVCVCKDIHVPGQTVYSVQKSSLQYPR